MAKKPPSQVLGSGSARKAADTARTRNETQKRRMDDIMREVKKTRGR